MAIQTILFIAGIVLLVAAAACAAVDAWFYFKKDIRAIRDDLTGKQRAKTIAEMDERSPASRRRMRQDYEPVTAAAEAAASVARRAAHAVDIEDVQPTAAPKPGNDVSDRQPLQEEPIAANPDEPETFVETDSGETIISVGQGNSEEDVTTVEGIQAQKPPAPAKASETGLAQIEIVKMIVLTDSSDFVAVGRRGETHE